MSRRREKKIKRLRRLSIWPHLIEAFFVEVAIIGIAIILVSVDISSDNHRLVSSLPKTCLSVIAQVQKDWDSSQKKLAPQAEDQINNLLKYNTESIGGVCIIDDDKNILASYGKKIEDEEDFFRKYSKKKFYEDGIYFQDFDIGSELEEDYDYGQEGISITLNDDEGTVINYTPFYSTNERQTILNYVNLFFKDSSLANKKMFAWATTPVGTNTLWIMYKTEVPGVNVAILKKVGMTQIDTGRHMFEIILFAICFIFIFIYENYKLFIAIANKHKIHRIIYTDPVTGGNNKDFFLIKAKKYIRRRSRSNVIVYLRMEKYRNYVTAYGIKEGENLMEDFYKLLRTMIKKRKELVAHLEKSDFVLLLHFDNEELLNIRMQSIAKALNDCRENQHLYFSVGACRINTKVDNLEEKISNAAAAISNQVNGSDFVHWFDEAMREEQVWERRVEDDMEKALENHEFQVYLQPKYSTKKEELSAAEALVRWIHPEFGFVSPGRFIPIFENNGFITKLDDYMLTEIAKLQAKWQAEGKKLVPISVNVSRAHFTNPELAEHICGIVDAYKVPHEYIELELTESAFFDDKQMLLGTVKKLKDFGFKVSMDDFGAGYSSLNSLKELPLDIIKLDAQFFRDIEDKKRADLIVCDTIKLAKKLGMQIVAEGIETREQVDFLANQHCDLIQGFYFAKPLPVTEFEERAFG